MEETEKVYGGIAGTILDRHQIQQKDLNSI